MKIYSARLFIWRWLLSFLCVALIALPFVFAKWMGGRVGVHPSEYPVLSYFCGFAIFSILEVIVGFILFGLYKLLEWVLDEEYIQTWFRWAMTQDIEDKFMKGI